MSMDTPTEKHGFRNYRMTGNQHYYMKGDNTMRNDRKYKWVVNKNSRSRKHPFRSKNDHVSRRNYRQIQRRSMGNDSSKTSNQSVEDAEEEERRKKLSTTANALLSKIQTWRADIQSETSNQPTNNPSSSNPESSKPKRIAHSLSKTTTVQKPTPKNSKKIKKSSKVRKYDVNKATVKDFQNRIRHKLINEIMQMPKENLQNVLNDPKINPIMEVKMSRLVRENKLLICQKLRTLAESKMMTNGSSQLLLDIDKLIDPVIETDLSVLPYELIKEMENIFQVQFDYTNCGIGKEDCALAADSIACGEIVTPEDILASVNSENVLASVNSEDNPSSNMGLRTENRSLSDDLRVYECSTDEDEDLGNENKPECSIGNLNTDSCQSVSSELKDTAFRTFSDLDEERKLSAPSIEETPSENLVGLISVKDFANSNQSLGKENVSSVVSESKSTQTSDEPQLLYGIPLPRQSTNNNPTDLLEEVNSIQNLVTKLNERRFMIFLQLAKTDPDGSFILDKLTRRNFIESVTNGDLSLVESLMKFFH